MNSIPEVKNLLQTIDGSKEQIFELLSTGAARLEHIVSCGEASDTDFWYDQDHDEWVMLVQGTARLQFEADSLKLRAGDSLLIPAKQRHRVSQVSEDAIWLALHFSGREDRMSS